MVLATLINYAFQCMWSFVLPYKFHADQANMDSKISFIFTGISFLWKFMSYFVQPETAGRSFEEIDNLYNKNVPLWEWKSCKSQKQQDSDIFYDNLKQEMSHAVYVISSQKKFEAPSPFLQFLFLPLDYHIFLLFSVLTKK